MPMGCYPTGYDIDDGCWLPQGAAVSSVVYPDPQTKSSRLPIIQKDFTHKLGMARYCTTRSVYRGRDAERKRKESLRKPKLVNLVDISKVEDELKLPEISLEAPAEARKETQFKKKMNQIDTYKTCLKLKGLSIQETYGLNRNRNVKELVRMQNGKQLTPRQNPKMKLRKKLPKLVETTLTQKGVGDGSDTSVALNSSNSEMSTCYTKENDTISKIMEKRLQNLLKDDQKSASNMPTIRSKMLGGIVSSKRLGQLLTNGQPIFMENFYNFYPK